MNAYKKLDQEWVELMEEAKELGIGMEELKLFLSNQSHIQTSIKYYTLLMELEESRGKL
ncbi:anti-repressor SinI family protein [Sediminibacillus albus]|uniref:Anti-repressor SinI n=1 Tax=Sediminibacillus albus TaxID=407036 RepID=A0A1G9A0K8_9BACI|nr:anti-repressor SinI family protein [Sediminibacillus albus]SDK20737.1 Anti-repressor SinI [Sediminibacillus albus]